MNDTEERITVTDGTELYLCLYPAANPHAEILIIHGFGEHSGRYQALIAHLREHNYSVTVYDQRGHGKSAGLYGHVDAFTDYEEDLEWIIAFIHRQSQSKKLFL